MKRMKTIRILILTISALMMLAILTACVDDDPVKNKSEGHTLTVTFSATAEDIPETKAVVRKANAGSEAEKAGFSYELVSSDADSSFTSPSTKAPTTLKNAYALLFKSDGTFNGRANIGTMTAGTNTSVTFTNVTDVAATGGRLVVVANDNAATNSYASTKGTGNFASFTGNYAAFQTLEMTNAISSDADIPYVGSVTVDLSSGGFESAVSVPLYRTLAKVTLTNTFNITDGPARNSISFYNQGTKYFAPKGNNNYDGTGNTQTTSFVATTTGSNADINTWYVGENIRPTGSNITSAADRNSSKAPSSSGYIRITSANLTEGNATLSFTYDIYLGKGNDVADFSVRRHTNYTITSTVSGTLATQKYLAQNDGRVTITTGGTSITINQALANTYKAAQSNLTDYPPFNYDGGATSGITGYDYGGISTSATVITPYTIEVDKIQSSSTKYVTAIDYCKGLGTGWRIPTIIELKGIYDNRAALRNAGCASFTADYHWSSSVYDGSTDDRCLLTFDGGVIRGGTTVISRSIRCVREITLPALVSPIVTIDQTTADTYKSWISVNFSNHPPFNYDGGASSGTTGYDYGGVSASATVITPYTIEVEKTNTTGNYKTATSYCKGLGAGWRVPTYIELRGICDNKARLEAISGFTAFGSYYWSSSVVYGDPDKRSAMDFSRDGGGISSGSNANASNANVRCVREVTPPGEVPSAIVTIDQTMADAYKAAQSDLTTYPPFNYNYGVVTGTKGSDYKGTSSTATISTPYTIEVSKEQPAGTFRYDDGSAKNRCASGWRLPTMIESYVMYKKKAKLEAISDFDALTSSWYWSSSVCNGDTGKRCDFHFGNGNFSSSGTNVKEAIRCVRDI